MARRKRPVHEEEHENHERWLITYADMITLLLALFMMLYAMSVLDLNKFKAFQEAFSNGNGKHVHSLPGEGDPPAGEKRAPDVGATTGPLVDKPPPIPANTAPVLSLAQMNGLKAKLVAQLKKAGLQDDVTVANDTRGLVVNITSSVLFDTASWSLNPAGQQLLVKLGPVLKGVGNDLVVEGHTDSRPLNGTMTNWELSTSRATAVVRHLLEDDHLPATRLSASGFADTRPVDKGKTETAYAHNRRVDIVVIAKPSPAPAATQAAPTPAPTPSAAQEQSHEDSGGGH